MFGIIRCPNCSELQGYEIRSKTTTCHTCSKRIDISRSQVFGPYNDQNEMRKKIWDMKSGNMNDSEASLTMEMIDTRDRSVKKVLNRSERDESVLRVIDEGSSTFDEVLNSIGDMDILEDELNDILSRLQRSNRIFSPRFGVYKKVN